MFPEETREYDDMGILKGRFILVQNVHAVIEEDKHVWVSWNYRNDDEQGFLMG